ncbi:MAG: prolyl oligopeptidase family serine peptidase [Gemmatimonadota bacterium]
MYMHERRRSRLMVALVLLIAAAGLAPHPLVAQAAQDTSHPMLDGKKILTLDDYGEWRQIRSVQLSPDGRWLAFSYVPNDGDSELHVKALQGDADYTASNGASPVFASDGAHVAFLTSPPEEQAKKLRRQHKPVPRMAHWIDLRTGARDSIADARDVTFAEGGRWLVVHKARADRQAKFDGSDLVLVDLSSGALRNIGNVSAFAFDSLGNRLAYLVDAADRTGNGAYLLDPASGRTVALSTGDYLYDGLSWSADGKALAVLRGDTVNGMEQRANVLLAWPDAEAALAGSAKPFTYDPAKDAAFPDSFVLSEHARPTWTKDDARLVVGIKEQKTKVKPEGDPEDRGDVTVWHYEDERVQSVQKVQAAADRRFTYTSVVSVPAGHFVRLATEAMPRVEVVGDGAYAIGRRDGPYRLELLKQPGQADIVRIDTGTGQQTVLADSVRDIMGASPDGHWYAWSRNGTVMAADIATGETVNLSQVAGIDFSQNDSQMPGEIGTWGVAGWSKDGRWILLNTRYDVWAVPLEAAANRAQAKNAARDITGGLGARDSIRFRVEPDFSFDTHSPRQRAPRRFGRRFGPAQAVDLAKPMMLSAYGDWTKKSGWWRLDPGAAEPKPLVWGDAMYGSLTKAQEADVVAYTRQTFQEFPDWWVTDTRFRRPRKVTDGNPQLKEYAWGTRRLIDYTDSRGNHLQATLTLPAGYQKGKKYPMLVYFYEKLSQRHHQFSQPVYDDRPHMSEYASDGYLVLMPDIVYTIGHPGSSALDDVSAAVHKVIDLGYADPAHIGLQGHSWGGYESSYIVTQTNLFAAVVTGAPLTDLVSMHNILYKRTGGPNARIIEWSQGRMGVTPWDSLSLYEEQSPVINAPKITTPFLILQGTADGAVDWNQGLEFYIAARELGKKVIFLSYADEPHHLARKANQIDFQRRMKQFFDHYLKGAPAPQWMKDGVPWLDRAREQAEEQKGRSGNR